MIRFRLQAIPRLPTRRAISTETHSAAAALNNNNNNNFDDNDHQQRSQPTSSLTWPRFMTG
jgi:hypothetical protein